MFLDTFTPVGSHQQVEALVYDKIVQTDFVAQAHIRLLYIKDIREFVLPDPDVSYFATLIEKKGSLW